MKRTPLKRKTPMKRSQKPLKRTPLKKQSQSKSSKEKRASYSKAKKEYMEFDRLNGFKHCCEKCKKNVGIENLDLHHKAGRTGSSINQYGEMERNLTNKATFMAVCRTCHNWIHENPKESREMGWLI